MVVDIDKQLPLVLTIALIAVDSTSCRVPINIH